MSFFISYGSCVAHICFGGDGDGNGGSRILAAIGLGFVLTVVGFKVVVPDDPYADLSDTYLEKLKGDDDIANDAAKKVRRYLIFFVPTHGAH